MLDENIEKACILEDDVLLDDEFPRTLTFLNDFNFKNTVVKLDNYREKNTPCSIWVKKKVSERVMFKKPVTTQWMAWGYIIDRIAAANILNTWPKIEFVCDDWKRMSKAVEIRCVQPAVVHQNAAVESVIDEDRKELLEKTKQRESRAYIIKRYIHIVKTLFLMIFS
jgi:GR25 family glycosyltransferase involved in LPS biosynthesis